MGIIILVILVLLLFLYFRNIKIIKVNSLNLFTGQLGTGKSALSLWMAIKYYHIHTIKFTIKYVLQNAIAVFNKNYTYWNERPLFYSNIPLKNIKYIELTGDILLRKKRINNASIVFIDEISLIVDNYDFKDLEINENLKMFIKLFRHYSHNGKLFINTQNISDNHYIIKRSLNQYIYIHSKLRLPFISILKVREMQYSEDTENINNSDIEDNLKTIIITNKIFKRYDNICYSILTDNKEFIRNQFKKFKYKKQLKTNKILKIKESKNNDTNKNIL